MSGGGEHAAVGPWAAAYALGALEAGERRRFEQHRSTCPRCQAELASFAPIPSLLGRLDLRAVDGLAVPAGAVAALSARTGTAVAERARAQYHQLAVSRRRWRLATAGALAVAAVATVMAVVAAGGPAPAPARPVVAAAIVDSEVATAVLTTSVRAWGTEVAVEMTGVPRRDRYQLWAVARDGTRTPVAAWGPTSTGATRLTGATEVPTDRIRDLLVTADDGAEVLVRASVEPGA